MRYSRCRDQGRSVRSLKAAGTALWVPRRRGQRSTPNRKRDGPGARATRAVEGGDIVGIRYLGRLTPQPVDATHLLNQRGTA